MRHFTNITAHDAVGLGGNRHGSSRVGILNQKGFLVDDWILCEDSRLDSAFIVDPDDDM